MDAKELLEKYVNRQLNEQEREQVKTLLKDDADFRKEFIREKAMAATIRAREKSKLRKELKGYLKDIKPTEESTQTKAPEAPHQPKIINLRTRRLITAVAASLTLLLVSYFAFMNQGPNLDQLYADNYRVYKVGINSTRDTNETLQHPAAQAYIEENYDQAIAQFQQLLNPTDSNVKAPFSKDAIQLYLGNAYLNTAQFALAIAAFQQVASNTQSALSEDASWYLALTHLKAGNTEEARELLDMISKGDNIYTNDAKEIKDAL